MRGKISVNLEIEQMSLSILLFQYMYVDLLLGLAWTPIKLILFYQSTNIKSRQAHTMMPATIS